MKASLFHTIETLLNLTILAIAIHLVLVLYLDGYTFSWFFLKIKARQIASPTILLLFLLVLRFPITHRGISRDVFFAHAPAMLFSILMIFYMANGTTKGSGDTLPARYLPLSILREGNFDLNEFPFLYEEETPYYISHIKGRYVSNYPVAPAIAALPFYLPSALGRVGPRSPLLEDLEKFAAASLVALSAVILYLLLRRLTSPRLTLFVAAAYALGTSSLSVSSQGLWQHGPSQLALTTALYCLVRGRMAPLWVGVAGFPLAFAVICRPTDLLLALALGAYVVLYHRRQLPGFVLSGLPPGLFQLWYNTVYFGDAFRTQFSPLNQVLWSTPLWEGLPGILISPSRGLFIYSPILLFSFFGMALAWRRSGDPLLRALSMGILPTLLLYSKWFGWWGGGTYGPRLLADLTPALAVCLVPLQGLFEGSQRVRWAFLGLAAWSIAAHSIGAFWDDGRWNASPNIDISPHRLWSVTDSPLLEYGRDTFGRAWIAVGNLPTSRRAPELLSATYRLDPASLEMVMGSVRLAMTATNTGQSVWLSTAKKAKGVVRLGWRWIKDGGKVPQLSGQLPLRHDVFPGSSYTFQISIPPPPEPGQYVLELGMLSEHIMSFSDRGVAPITIPVVVSAWTAEALTQYLNSRVAASREMPRLLLATHRAGYRPGDELPLSVVLEVFAQPVLVDMYLALLGPGGNATFYAGDWFTSPTGTRLPALGRRVYLPRRFRLSHVGKLRLVDGLPPGVYTLYFVLTEADSYRILARAAVQFRVEP